jgi:hypothetical protein
MTSDKFEAIFDFLEELMMGDLRNRKEKRRQEEEERRKMNRDTALKNKREKNVHRVFVASSVSCKNLHKRGIKIFDVQLRTGVSVNNVRHQRLALLMRFMTANEKDPSYINAQHHTSATS